MWIACPPRPRMPIEPEISTPANVSANCNDPTCLPEPSRTMAAAVAVGTGRGGGAATTGAGAGAGVCTGCGDEQPATAAAPATTTATTSFNPWLLPSAQRTTGRRSAIRFFFGL